MALKAHQRYKGAGQLAGFSAGDAALAESTHTGGENKGSEQAV